MPVHNKKIGDRIKELRKAEHLSQEEFASSLGVKRGYISTLETHRNEPSKQLILNICRAFGILYGWLKFGTGERYEAPRLTPRGRSIMTRIIKEVMSPERKLPLNMLAQILDIDPYMSSNRLNLPKDFYAAVNYLIQIFQEGDPNKIEAILAQLKAFMPKAKVDKLKEVS